MIEILSLVLIGGIILDHHKRIQTLRAEARNYGKQTA
jgi:hypothetical protein